MRVLFKSATIFDSFNQFHLQKKDILIEDGIIKLIDDLVTVEADQTVVSDHLCVSPGWLDLRVHLKEPGFEDHENLDQLTQEALSGGFTGIGLLPNSKPVSQTKEAIKAINSYTQNSIVDFYPYGAVSINCEAKDFTDMLDLNNHGAIGFTDGEKSLNNPDFILKTLLYLSQFGGLFINHPNEPELSKYGQMNESKVSNLLGMKGIPKVAEEIAIDRDIKLLNYLNESGIKAKYHFSLLSTKESVQLIRIAKEKGLNVSADVAIHQLLFVDSDLYTFDTNYKVKPPFRDNEDKQALCAGLLDGTIDTIVSDHNAFNAESKNLEFDLAEFGIMGLGSFFGALNTNKDQISLDKLIDKLTHNPRSVLGLPRVEVKVGQEANLTFFDPKINWQYQPTKHHPSNNSPFIGKKFIGKPLGVINKSKIYVSK
jgi:dihydroorotase